LSYDSKCDRAEDDPFPHPDSLPDLRSYAERFGNTRQKMAQRITKFWKMLLLCYGVRKSKVEAANVTIS
jgi:hypothetical protein